MENESKKSNCSYSGMQVLLQQEQRCHIWDDHKSIDQVGALPDQI